MPSPNRFVAVFAMLLGGFLAHGQAQAHCDSLDGPVVQDARIALEKGDPAFTGLVAASSVDPGIAAAMERRTRIRSPSRT